ncbi:pirin family protein [Alteromonas sp. D210916BOD_24]|uniref:pirin family protein n=1 Tax=Alteromonas sp. D210916BOD_24 TaxID=3157618 RepID=UPI00399CB8DB
MVYLRKASARGKVNLGWLDSKHSFSFGHYYDANHMGFSALRVINDDVVQGGRGFETHGHRDMEIISYVVSGELKHKDNTGNEYIVPAGDIQVMSAGKGIMHSEFNPSADIPVNFLQIWIVPNQKGGDPSYAQKTVGKGDAAGSIVEVLVNQSGNNGALPIKQDAAISRITLKSSDTLTLTTASRKGYLHVVSGEVTAKLASEKETISLNSGDAIGLYINETMLLSTPTNTVALWFDLPE